MKRLLLASLSLLWCVRAAAQPAIVPDKVIPLFNGKDLSPFVTWLPAFKHEDPDKVFTVVDQIDGAPAIRVSGQHWGGFVTKERYANYRLIVEYRWGSITWGTRKNSTRDGGILLHCQGPFGNAKADFTSPWIRSVEFQIIEGGTGDFILVSGWDKAGGPRTSPELTVTTDGKSKVWKPGGTPTRFNTGRIDWWGRDLGWKDVLGFRGPKDVEKAIGEWNRVEITCDGGSFHYVVNGVVVNEGTDSNFREGTLLFQSEGAEMFFRRIELHPLKR